MKEKILLIGGGGHSRAVVDILLHQQLFEIAGFVDTQVINYKGITTLGNDSDLKVLFNSGIRFAFICVGALANTGLREKLFFTLREVGFYFPNVIHSSVVLGDNVQIGVGNFIGAGVIVNGNTKIGNNCLINTGVILEHDVILEDHVHLSPRATVCGGTKIGANSFIGAGSTILESLEISAKTVIGASSLVNMSILELGSYGFGVPFRRKIR